MKMKQQRASGHKRYTKGCDFIIMISILSILQATFAHKMNKTNYESK